MSEAATTGAPNGIVANAQRILRGDILFAAGVMAILAMLILPIPRWLLDICLAISITFSVLILMTAL
ncbi:MAG: hypothetical protein AAGL49_06770, partial [Pseudomonadota bacterium]